MGLKTRMSNARADSFSGRTDAEMFAELEERALSGGGTFAARDARLGRAESAPRRIFFLRMGFGTDSPSL